VLDIKFIRDNSDLVKKAVELKNLTLSIDELLKLDNDLLEKSALNRPSKKNVMPTLRKYLRLQQRKDQL
jgi:seryl-tRNA synthetase